MGMKSLSPEVVARFAERSEHIRNCQHTSPHVLADEVGFQVRFCECGLIKRRIRASLLSQYEQQHWKFVAKAVANYNGCGLLTVRVTA